MPPWVQYVLGISALLIALGVIWKTVKSVAKLITLGEKAVPMMEKLCETFKDSPTSLDVLREIAAQFRTDSGSTLRDVVNRLETTANENRAASETLKVEAKVIREVAKQDRENIARLLILVDRLNTKTQAGAETGLRIEAAAGVVADDLKAAHQRADEASGDAGAAADAAAQTEKLKDGQDVLKG